MFRHILLASDGSDCALKAAEAAAVFAAKFGSQLTIINVQQITPMVGPYGEVVSLGLDDACIDSLQEAALQGAGRIADAQNVRYQKCKEIGNAAAEIVRAAEEKGCDLIVVGSRGLGGIKSFVLGSVSDQVTHHAHCPVLIVR